MRALSVLAIVALASACGDTTTLIASGPVERLDDTSINVSRPHAESMNIRAADRPLPMPSFEVFEPLPQAVVTDLRVRGSNAAALQGVLLRANELRIVVDGVEVPYSLHSADLDLANVGPAWRLASFEMPEGARFVQVVLDLEEDSGTFVDATTDGQVIAPGAPIYFDSPASLIAKHNKLVLDLDLSRSLVANSTTELEVVPVFRVDY